MQELTLWEFFSTPVAFYTTVPMIIVCAIIVWVGINKGEEIKKSREEEARKWELRRTLDRRAEDHIRNQRH